jgi:hypothetical protein
MLSVLTAWNMISFDGLFTVTDFCWQFFLLPVSILEMLPAFTGEECLATLK